MLAKTIDYTSGDSVTQEEFIAIANSVNCKVEFLEGRIYFLAGGSRKHTRIKSRFAKLLIEVLSKSTGYVDEHDKKNLYQKLGVEEYLVADQYTDTLTVYHLLEQTQEVLTLSNKDIFKSKSYKGLELPLDNIFNYDY